MARIPVAVQLFTLRSLCEKDLISTLEKVASLGYAGVEFAGTFGVPAEKLRAELARLRLKACSAHVSLPEMQADPNKVISYWKTVGTARLVCPWIGVEDRSPEGWAKNTEALRKLVKEFRAAGVSLAYHNHDFEFQKHPSGRYILDVLFSEIPDLEAELDLFWVRRGGEEPLAYARKYAGRLPLVHVKDSTPDGKFAPVGTGVIDFTPFFAEAGRLGVQWYIVEQDQTYDTPPLDAVKTSIENLKRMGIA